MDSETRIKLLICLVSHFGSFDNSCSFDSWTLPAWNPPAADTLRMPAPSASKCLYPQSLLGHGKYKRASLERVFPVPTLNVTGFHGKPVMQRRPICRRQILHGPMFNQCMKALTRTRFGINRVSAPGVRRWGIARMSNKHKSVWEVYIHKFY